MARRKQPRISPALDRRLGQIHLKGTMGTAIKSDALVNPVIGLAEHPSVTESVKSPNVISTRTRTAPLSACPKLKSALKTLLAEPQELGVKQHQSLNLPSDPLTLNTPNKLKLSNGSSITPRSPKRSGKSPCKTQTNTKLGVEIAGMSLDPNGLLGRPSPRPPLMSHVDRQKLIRLPFHSQRLVGASHGGTTLNNSGSVPTEGHRTWQVSPADESYLRYGKFEGEID